ncbi:MAG: hypothetical protein ACRCYO_03375 [Bacteroidia bacterium]
MSNVGSDRLHRLIHSLTKSEKRHFKLFSARHAPGETSNYVRLFDAIEVMKVYNEEKLLQQFRKEDFIRHFSITKSRLFESVLRSLDVFHHASSVDAELWKELHFAEILYKKTHYDMCARRLEIARRLATRYEKFAVLAQISDMEKTLAEKDSYSGRTETDIAAMQEDDNHVGEKMRVFNELWNVKSLLFMQLNNRGPVQNSKELSEYRDSLDRIYKKTKPTAMSQNARFMYHHAYSAYHFAAGQYEDCREHLEKNTNLIETNTDIFRDEPNIYFGVLTNLIYITSRLRRYDDVMKNLKKLRALPEKLDTARNEDLELKLFSSAYSLELTLYNTTGRFEKSVAIAPRIEKELERFEGKLSILRQAYFRFTIAVGYFGAGKLQAAQRWINKLTNDPGIEQTEAIFIVAQVFSIVIHFELGYDDQIPYLIRATRRYLKIKRRAYKFERLMLRFFDQYKSTNLSGFAALSKELVALEKDNFERAAFEYFDFPAWAESKCNGVSFRSIVEDKSGMKEEL